MSQIAFDVCAYIGDVLAMLKTFCTKTITELNFFSDLILPTNVAY